jgi:hypothetical protein
VSNPLARRLVVSLHDVHPGSGALIREQRSWLESLGVTRASLLVIPDYHERGGVSADEALCDWLRARVAAGDEVVQHGYHHLRTGANARRGNMFWTRFYTANEAEFLDLSRAEAGELIRRGRDELARAGLRAEGFIAPAWLLGEDARCAVWEAGFQWTNTIDRVSFRDGREVHARSLCWSSRAAWRRTVSVGWNECLQGRLRGQPVGRVSLHPGDHAVPSFRRQVERIVRQWLASGDRCSSYESLGAVR